ncbi:unnamed protein product [Symbiodinium natans]|uniref:Uncharacterized protein n=1 Tax=Symbiodinium natans TaxID=878477 RepID=A0A812TYF3_9DINO|nr:unnamed protein product [Symbiodinium natans]
MMPWRTLSAVMQALWVGIVLAEPSCENAEAVKGSALLQRALQNHGAEADLAVAEASSGNRSRGCGMGFSGTCLTNTDWAYQMANYVPGDGAGFFNTFVKVWMDVTPLNGFIFCIGDRPGSWIVGNEYGTSSQLYDSYQGLTYLRNFFISPTDMEDWGTLGYYTTLFCPSGTAADLYTELKVAFAFNKCGTAKVNFLLSISPDTFECFADKLVPVLSRVVGMVPEFTFGISVDRKMSKTVTLAHGDGDDIEVADVTMGAHLGLSVLVRLSVGQILGADDTLGDVLAGDLQMQAVLSYDGDLRTPLTAIASADVVSILPDLLAGVVSAQQVGPTLAAIALRQAGANSNVVDLVEQIQRATLMFVVTGYVTLALAGPTTGILPDLSFQLFTAAMMLRMGPPTSSDLSKATGHLPGLYFYFSADMGAFVESIVKGVVGQIGGLLDVVGVNVDSGVSLSASSGIGFFLNTAGVGFDAEVKIGGSATSIKCVFKFNNRKLRCKARLGWAELFLQNGKYVLNKINNFAGDGVQEVAEFYSDKVGGPGSKFSKQVVNNGKKVVNKVKCKLSNLLGGKCGKSGGNPSQCGDGTEYVIKNEQDKCLQASWDCYAPDSQGKVYYYQKNCLPVFRDCTHMSSSYAEQMKQYWWYTTDRKLCNEYMHNMYFADISNPDDNPKCLRLHDQQMYFAKPGQSTASIGISKTSTERFKIYIRDVTGPYGQVCLQSSSGGATLDQGRRRQPQKVFVRGYDGGRRRRRCSKDGGKKWRIYQKLEPGNGGNYDKENGDAQFNNGCR